jgi:hypothetical protein
VLSYSGDVVEVKERYDDLDNCINNKCTITLDIEDEMEEPVYLYYELTNYYQNHRIYLNSRNQDQLAGEDLSKSDLATCEPIVSNDDLDFSQIKHDETLYKRLDGDDAAFPCGLVAMSFFTDSFKLKEGETVIDIDTDEIAWMQDRENRYENLDNMKGQWLDIENGNSYLRAFCSLDASGRYIDIPQALGKDR